MWVWLLSVRAAPLMCPLSKCGALIMYSLRARFALDIEEMTGERPGWYWRICWNFVSPVVMFTILVASLVFRFMHRPTYLAWDRHAVRHVRSSMRSGLKLKSGD